jgi:hypothetical protein
MTNVQQRLCVHASVHSRGQIRTKLSHGQNLLSHRIANRYSQLESKNREKQTNVESKLTQPEFRKQLITSLVIV